MRGYQASRGLTFHGGGWNELSDKEKTTNERKRKYINKATWGGQPIQRMDGRKRWEAKEEEEEE